MPNTYLQYGLIKRYSGTNIEYISFNLENILSGREDIKLEPRDRIYIFPKQLLESEPQYSIYGSVRKPGTYRSWDSNFRLKDLVMKAGGLKRDAYLKDAEIVSYKVVNGVFTKIKDIHVNLKNALAGDPKDNVLLKPYDTVIVKRALDWGNVIRVKISGEVKFPGVYVLKKGARLSDLIEKAGGYKNDAYLDGAKFIMPSAQKIQQQALNSLISRLESEIYLTFNSKNASTLNAQEVQSNKAQMVAAQQFINTLKSHKALGRVVVKLAPVRIMKGSPYDIQLEDHSSLYIPPKPDIINVVGAVMSPSSFSYNPDFSYKDYIKLAGGYTEYADKNNVFVLKADGSAYKVSSGFVSWNPYKSRWQINAFSSKRKLMPGDTIVVPSKLSYVPWLRNVKDITQILMQMAVTTGVIVKLF